MAWAGWVGWGLFVVSQGLGCSALAADIILDIPTDLQTINRRALCPPSSSGVIMTKRNTVTNFATLFLDSECSTSIFIWFCFVCIQLFFIITELSVLNNIVPCILLVHLGTSLHN